MAESGNEEQESSTDAAETTDETAGSGGDEHDAEETGLDEPEDYSETKDEEEASPSDDRVAEETIRAEDADGEDEEEDGAKEESHLSLSSVVEAILFAAREPLKPSHIARAVGKRTRQEAVREAVDELNVQYLETGRAFEIAEISGKYQLMSRPEFAPHIMKIYPKRELAGEKEKTQRLTPAALDTLAIIAYKQPVTRAEIEHIRGVGCGPVLKALLERDSIRIAGKRMDMLGQPLVYGTTEHFLVEFGLGSLEELPMRNDFLALLGMDIPPVDLAEEQSPAEAAGDNASSGDPKEESVSAETDTKGHPKEPLPEKNITEEPEPESDETVSEDETSDSEDQDEESKEKEEPHSEPPVETA